MKMNFFYSPVNHFSSAGNNYNVRKAWKVVYGSGNQNNSERKHMFLKKKVSYRHVEPICLSSQPDSPGYSVTKLLYDCGIWDPAKW